MNCIYSSVGLCLVSLKRAGLTSTERSWLEYCVMFAWYLCVSFSMLCKRCFYSTAHSQAPSLPLSLSLWCRGLVINRGKGGGGAWVFSGGSDCRDVCPPTGTGLFLAKRKKGKGCTCNQGNIKVTHTNPLSMLVKYLLVYLFPQDHLHKDLWFWYLPVFSTVLWPILYQWLC